MTKSKTEARQKPGPKPKPRYRCVACCSELGARELRTHRRKCPCRSMFCANLQHSKKPGPKSKIHYLCMACHASLSESGVRTHHRDCQAVEPTLAELEAKNTALKARIARLEELTRRAHLA